MPAVGLHMCCWPASLSSAGQCIAVVLTLVFADLGGFPWQCKTCVEVYSAVLCSLK